MILCSCNQLLCSAGNCGDNCSGENWSVFRSWPRCWMEN